ncbi:MAG: phosphopantothenoylcysteine decarboxylase domain-containing protein [Planctomycetota bacterium]|jgi:phosphopantothenoylcysteine decarboxylase/phosphopantothenate--cysteine ligase
MQFLITAGPTREPIDGVRFLSNRSTGKMGFAVAEAALKAGHDVILVFGPGGLALPSGAVPVAVETALEMEEAVKAKIRHADALVMSAAVADYRPETKIEGKFKKGEGEWVLTLVRNPDILAGAGRIKGDRIHVGFAVESSDLLENASLKLEAKNLDLIVANGLAAFGADRSTVHFLTPDGPTETFSGLPKSEIAQRIVTFCESLHRTRTRVP